MHCMDASRDGLLRTVFCSAGARSAHAPGGLTSRLGGEFGVDTPKPLKARMITIFQAGVASNVWDMGDVPDPKAKRSGQ